MKTCTALLCLLLAAPAAAENVRPSEMMLAQEYRRQDIRGWLASEKLDGVRAFWNGGHLVSRGGHILPAPDWFTRGFPPYALDGELYGGRGRFEQTSAAVRGSKPEAWRNLHYHVFDVPDAEGGLLQRLSVLEGYLKNHPSTRIRPVPQTPVADTTAAHALLRRIESAGGEGLILRHPDAPYPRGRSSLILKMKSEHDEECRVVAHHPGRGRHEGRLGAVSCENRHGTFRIGSGFSDRDRADPPPVGSTITYRYRGFTQRGTPRFATFVRIRAAE